MELLIPLCCCTEPVSYNHF